MEVKIIEIIKNNAEDYILNINKIKPKNIKKSDKYSKQIYQFLKKNPGHDRVYYIQTQDVYNKSKKEFEQKEVPFDTNHISIRYLWICSIPRRERYENPKGYIDWIYGNSLSTIVSPSREKYTVFANPWNNKKIVVDVTKEFWEKYIEIGRCIYGEHPFGLQDDDGHYTYYDSTHRKCNWCGKEEHLETKTYSYTRDEWIED